MPGARNPSSQRLPLIVAARAHLREAPEASLPPAKPDGRHGHRGFTPRCVLKCSLLDPRGYTALRHSPPMAAALPTAERDARHLALGRGVALFLGAFTLLNLVGQRVAPGYDASQWWIDLRPLPGLVARPLLAVCAALLLAHGVAPASPTHLGWSPTQRQRRRVTFVAVLFLLTVTASNAVTFWALRVFGTVSGAAWIPLSLVLAVSLGSVLVSLGRGDERDDSLDLPPEAAATATVPRGSAQAASTRVGLVAVATIACGLLFPLALMCTLGPVDYRRVADVIVVPGARAYADGRPSPALSDRVLTAVQLYHEGLAPRLFFSGGPGDGAVHETLAMQRLAVSRGVPPAVIVRDEGGLDTQATARNAAGYMRLLGLRRALAVSHFYHLPRVKLSLGRAGVAQVFTVPAPQHRVMRGLPWFMLREVAGLWWYWLTVLPRPTET